MTSRPITDSRLTIIRYLFRANVVDLQPMGDRLTRWIRQIGVQKVDERVQDVPQKIR